MDAAHTLAAARYIEPNPVRTAIDDTHLISRSKPLPFAFAP